MTSLAHEELHTIINKLNEIINSLSEGTQKTQLKKLRDSFAELLDDTRTSKQEHVLWATAEESKAAACLNYISALNIVVQKCTINTSCCGLGVDGTDPPPAYNGEVLPIRGALIEKIKELLDI